MLGAKSSIQAAADSLASDQRAAGESAMPFIADSYQISSNGAVASLTAASLAQVGHGRPVERARRVASASDAAWLTTRPIRMGSPKTSVTERISGSTYTTARLSAKIGRMWIS